MINVITREFDWGVGYFIGLAQKQLVFIVALTWN